MNINLNIILFKLKALRLQFSVVFLIFALCGSVYLILQQVTVYFEIKKKIDAASILDKSNVLDLRFDNIPLSEAGLTEVVSNITKLHPGVSFSKVGNFVHVYAKSADDFEKWYIALYAIQSTAGRRILWDANNICIGTCPSGSVLFAELFPYRLNITNTLSTLK